MKTILLLFLISYSKLVHSQTDNDPISANMIIFHRLKMNPKTEFEKWIADQWFFAASYCAKLSNVTIPKEIKSLPTFSSGSWSLPDKNKGFCKALSNGPTPQCLNLRSTVEPFLFPPKDMPSNYAYMNTMIKEGTLVTVGGSCNLVENQFVTKQFFAGKGKVVWKQNPTQQSVTTSQGEVKLNMGTIAFDVDGMAEKNMISSAVILK